MIYVLGGDGFVGSAYARLCAARGLEHRVITRANYEAHIGTACALLINANGNSKKFLADRDPRWEFDASVRSVCHTLEDFRSDAYLYLSSGDVYPDPSSPSLAHEAAPIDVRRQSRYGLHKYLAEQLVLARHPRPLVLRMGGFVGSGMRKNAVFDMLHDQTVRLAPDSALQFIGTDTAADLVWTLVERQVCGEIVNLGATGTVRIGDLHARLGARAPFAPEAPTLRFEIATDKLAALTGRPLPESGAEVERYLRSVGR
ncbi:NAD-dependent epimerase/dehydratase family protein [Methylobacterium radiodurans]|uniref:NAD-dependent dehydratase n=1 Tax=Methylobacterium radiodurans TaxID=2202828 RepID=A0A2U8VLB0_9HYPH|nr:NAD-dependent epimerase/dehydratase family protein [Methylobacterium radiodurans]AWN34435.1 NAD-dependent dehydratase [Methylobacterium radiodurans]